jgi:hypothetical protein
MGDERAVREMQTAIEQQSGDTVTVPKATAEAALRPSQGATDFIFKMLVPGLLLLTVISLVGLIFLIADGNTATPPDLVLTTFTASLTGLLGLFVKSPTSP